MNINDFPSETLGEIFLHFVSPSKEHLSSPPFVSSRRSSASPYVVSKICKRWRDIALRLPSLWTHLHVVDPANIGIVQHLEEWMHRAGNLPLCLSLREYRFYSDKASIAVVTLFLNSLHRCQSFEMFIRTPLEYFGVGNFEMVPSLSLESVKVRCKDSSYHDGELLVSLLLSTRTLRTIRWSAAIGPLGTVSQSWENLRELSISGGRSLSDFVNALSCCQNLESLELRESFDNDWPGVSKSVTLPRLTRLSALLAWSTEIISLLFLPSLVELEIVLFGELEWGPALDLIQRSGVMLRKLGIITNNIISRSHVDHVEFLQVLKMPYFKALRILEVEDLLAGHDIIGFLTLPTNGIGVVDENEGTGGYLVHLEKVSLVFGNTRAMEISQGLRKLVKSRFGIQHTPKPVSEYIEIKTETIHGKQYSDIIFTLSIPT